VGLTPTGSSAKLFVVATPIGNLEDITLRAIRVLREVGCIAAEDTRHASVLLRHFDIHKPLVSCHQFNEARRLGQLRERFDQGGSVALITDAGTPGVSDPGERLIAYCVREGIPVEVIPGPSAVLHALVASGLPACPFVFEGFVPQKPGRRGKAVQALAAREATTVFFESPHRIARTLDALAEALPHRPICIARELTKKFEECLRGTAAELAAQCLGRAWRGEITLVVGGCDTDRVPPAEQETPSA
jgi:16S rRNA (cytidine1402-2'-O)-methyltransferase